jgi:SAM-dependent methyltransferase
MYADSQASPSRAAVLLGGEQDARDTLRVLRQLAGPAFKHDHVLDFGCGSGRLTIPLARTAEHTTGVDSSDELLAEARMNVEQAGLSNVDFVSADDALSGVTGRFEVVHSFDAFRRIPPAEGYGLAEAVLDRVTTRGGGMLHFTYAPGASSSTVSRAVAVARRTSGAVRRLLDRSEHHTDDPTFEYDLGKLFAMLQAKRFDRVATRFTDTDGHLGAKLFFWRGY